MAVTATFTVKDWDEQPLWEGPDGSKVTRADVRQTVEGGMAGDGMAHWLMTYQADGTAEYTGVQRVDAAIDGTRGTLIMRSTGTFDGTKAAGRLEIVGATDGLAGISGDGTFEAPHGSAATVTLQLSGTRAA